MLADEKARGTLHFAFGTNTGFGGINEARVHMDALIGRPTVELDGRAVLRDGVFVPA